MMRRLVGFFRGVSHHLDDSKFVPPDALMQNKVEAPSLQEKRQKAIEHLRSYKPSRYVLDGAKVSWCPPVTDVLSGRGGCGKT